MRGTFRCLTGLIALTFAVTTAVAAPAAPPAAHPAAADVARRYITAVGAGNYRTLIDLTFAYQREVAGIKDANPKAVWDRLIGEYYDRKIRGLTSMPAGFWGSYMEVFSGTMGDPTQNLRKLSAIFPKNCRWEITETRQGTVMDNLISGSYAAVTVFVTVSYPSLQTSPRIDKRFLKKSIFAIRVDSPTNLVRSVSRVSAGDVFWSPPYSKDALPFLAQMYASELTRGAGSDTTLKDLVALGPEVALPALRDIVAGGGRWALPAAIALADLKDVAVFPILLDQLRGTIGAPRPKSPCDPYPLGLVKTMGSFPPPQTEAVAYLKVVLGDLALGPGNRGFSANSECVTTYLETLGSLDGPAWRTFPYWQMGNELHGECPNGTFSRQPVEFQRIREDLCVHTQASSFIDPNSPTRDRVLTFLGSLSPCIGQSRSRCPAILVAEHLEIEDSKRARIIGHVNVFDSRPGQQRFKEEAPFELVLKGSGMLQTPWLVTDVVLPWEAPRSGSGSCSDARVLGYTVRDLGRDYGVLVAGDTDAERRIFEDGTGAPVSSPEILRRLSPAAWTYENVITPADVRSAADRVKGIRETLEHLQQYQGLQDALARAFVESLAAAVTGGPSLADAVPRVTWAVVREQLARPRVLLMLTARNGLQRSEQEYRQLTGSLPPPDVVSIDTFEAQRFKSSYTEARAMDVAYTALAADLMPQTGIDLLDQALTSMASEILPVVPDGDGTLSPADVFNLEKEILDLSETAGLLKAYRESFALAAALGSSNDKIIDKWATLAMTGCAGDKAGAPTGTSPARSDDFDAYSPIGDGYSWEFSVKAEGAKPDASAGTYTTRVDGTEMINGITYYKVVNLFGGQDASKAEVNYGRRGTLGFYARPATAKNSPEYLETPSPLVLGRQWKIAGPDREFSCSAAKAGPALIGDTRYDDVLRIDCQGTVTSRPFAYTVFEARDIGTIRQIVRPGQGALVFDLLSFKHPG